MKRRYRKQEGAGSMSWMKDADGNWYSEGVVLSSDTSTPSWVSWDKNENGAWFPVETGAVSYVPLFPRGVPLSLAV